MTEFSKVSLVIKPTFHETIYVLIIRKLTYCVSIHVAKYLSEPLAHSWGETSRVSRHSQVSALLDPSFRSLACGYRRAGLAEYEANISVKIILIQVYLNCFYEAFQVS